MTRRISKDQALRFVKPAQVCGRELLCYSALFGHENLADGYEIEDTYSDGTETQDKADDGDTG